MNYKKAHKVVGTLVRVTAVLLLAVLPATAGSITGKVKFSDASKPIGQCTVYTSSGITVQTDDQGNYRIDNVPAGAIGLRAWKLGFRPSPMTDWSIYSGYSPISVTVPESGTIAAPDLTILWGEASNSSTYINTTQVRHIYRTAVAPVIDGRVDAATEWKDAEPITPFYSVWDDGVYDPQTTVYMLYDDKKLYIAYDMVEPDSPSMKGYATGHDDTASSIYEDDHIEFEIDPLHVHNGWDGRAFTYSISANAKDAPDTAWSDIRCNQRRSDLWPDSTGYEDTNYAGWDPAGVKVVSYLGSNGHWYCEMSIPISQVPGLADKLQPGYVCGMQWMNCRSNFHANPSGATGSDGVLWTSGEWTFGGSGHNSNQFNDAVFMGFKPGTVGSITGKVVYKTDNSPVAGAVVITNKGGRAVTDANGDYTIPYTLAGDNKIMASVLGWQPSSHIDLASPVQPLVVPVTADATATAANLIIPNDNPLNTNNIVHAYKTSTPPTIDGIIDLNSEWKNTQTVSPFYVKDKGTQVANPQTEARVLYDDQNIYLSYMVHELPGGLDDLTANYFTHEDADAMKLSGEDKVVAFFDPLHHHNGPGWNEYAYEMGFNSNETPNTAYDDYIFKLDGSGDTTWESHATVAATRDYDNMVWRVEAKIPFSAFPELDGVAPAQDEIMGVLFARNRPTTHAATGDKYSAASFEKETHNYAYQYSDVVFSGQPTGTITGKVVYKTDNSPVAGAVVITNKGGRAVTDANGNYTIAKAPVGDTKIMASVLGWQPSSHVDLGSPVQPLLVPVSMDQTATAANLVIPNDNPLNTNNIVHAYKTSTPPTIDGVVNLTSEWKNAEKVSPFYVKDKGTQVANPQTEARVLYDDQNLYISYVVNELPGGMNELTAAYTNHQTADAAKLSGEDKVVLLFDPLHHHNGPGWNEYAYEVGFNSNPTPNTGYDDYIFKVDGSGDSTWESQATVAATRDMTGNKWYVEAKIPFKAFPELNNTTPAQNDIMGVLFSRNRPTTHTVTGDKYSAASFEKETHNYAYQYSDVVFAGTPSTVYTSPTGYVKGGRWNCVSVPADPVNPDPLVVFPNINVPDASFQYWKNNVDGGGFQSYGELFGWTGPITRGTAYWFLEATETTDKTLSFEGIPPTSDFELTVAAHTAAPFWIMFGTPFPTAVQAGNVRFKNVNKRGDVWLTWQEAFSDTNPTLRIVDSNAQGWDAGNNRFLGVTPPPWIGEASQLDPWWGYWLLVYDQNELKIKFPKP